MFIKPVFRILIYLEKRLHEVAYMDARSLSIFRIIFASYLLFFFNPSRYTRISEYPDIFYNPPTLSIAALFSKFPPDAFFQAVVFLLPLLFILLLFGYKTKYISLILSLLIIICDSFQYSLGKIDHGRHLPVIMLFLMTFSDWGRYYSIDSYNGIRKKFNKKRNYGLSLTALCICFGFFTAGVVKYTWFDLDLSTQAVRGWLNDTYYIKKSDKYLVGYFMELKNNLFWELIDSLAFLFETIFITACFTNRKIFRVYLCLAVFFHLANYLMLNIPFSYTILVYGAFVDWRKIILANKDCKKGGGNYDASCGFRKRLSLIFLGVICLLVTTLGLLGIQYTSLIYMVFPSYDKKLFIFLISSIIAVCYILSILYHGLYSSRKKDTIHNGKVHKSQ